MDRLRIGQYDDHFFCALRKGAFDGLGYMDFVSPLLGTDGVPVQCVHDGVAAMFVLLITGRQKHDDIAVDGVAFQIAFKRCAVDLDSLNSDWFAPGMTGGTRVWTCPKVKEALANASGRKRANVPRVLSRMNFSTP